MRFLIPEVVQTSAMDCGPAVLQSLLEGFGIPSSYGRLREACQTGLDGSSIDTIETVAVEKGLKAEQIMIPGDHLLLPEAAAIPAVVVVQLPSGATHFVVVWRTHGRFVQIMDPGVGRRWVKRAELEAQLYRHEMSVSAGDWIEFAHSNEFRNSLLRRLRDIGVANVDEVFKKAAAEDGWIALGALDAAVRIVSAVGEGQELLNRFLGNPDLIPDEYWSVRESENPEEVRITGAVLVRITGVERREGCPEECRAEDPSRAIWTEIFAAGKLELALLTAAVLCSGAAVLLEAIVFRELIDIAGELHLSPQRIGASAAVIILLSALLVLDLFLFAGCARLGRHVENRLRVRFLHTIPRLGDRYFQSRLISDMAERAHALHRIRNLPDMARQVLVAAVKIVAICATLAWLQPGSWPVVSLLLGASLIPPFISKGLLAECDLRVRNHAAGLTRFYLDAMAGQSAIRAHNAAGRFQMQQNRLLGCWAEAMLRMQRLTAAIETVQITVVFSLIAVLIWRSASLAHPGAMLLTVYWAMTLPTLSETLVTVSRRWVYYRNLTARLLEPIAGENIQPSTRRAEFGTIALQDVHVDAAGHSLLHGVSFHIERGEHVAVVGQSGAGKSTFAGCFLGWHTPSQGELLMNGEPIDACSLRPMTAWIDPAVQIWNKSVLQNVRYGSDANVSEAGKAIDAAMLREVLETLPSGLQTKLGEGGGLVSGGEGQRIRLARAMLRRDAKFVILDEPFRGLDREKRQCLMRAVRELWSDAAILCITHDISETLEFDRVVVMENGTIAEQGSPHEVAADKSSRYAKMLAMEAANRSQAWSAATWRRIRVQNGRVIETVRVSERAAAGVA